MPRFGQKKIFSTYLAPMSGLTTPRFMGMISAFGGPDGYISEFLRVHPTSVLRDDALNLLSSCVDSRDLSVQLLGRDSEHFLRTAIFLRRYGVSSINLNFGCPIPKIRKKGVGGALLAELDTIDAIIAALFAGVDLPISVKTRIGYHSPCEFAAILEHLSRHKLSALYLHARTVAGLYEEPVDFEHVKIAKKMLKYPVIANGDVGTAADAINVAMETGAVGVMIGRAAVSNPWIFRQIGELMSGKAAFIPSGEDYLVYVEKLGNFSEKFPSAEKKSVSESRIASSMKKYMVPVSDFVDPCGDFPRQMRRVESISALMVACEKFFTERYVWPGVHLR
ncbi:MAG: tRNA-dihydrouridine synthase family protein [Puniceicoccales bacterium]|jgi:tRNA-dihydrouridine synthase|nr:tRNA-dihydrouridine synthase family protein [Puniceicoccales bacterium]